MAVCVMAVSIAMFVAVVEVVLAMEALIKRADKRVGQLCRGGLADVRAAEEVETAAVEAAAELDEVPWPPLAVGVLVAHS